MTRGKILVTGASGFVGAAVLARLRHDGRTAVGVSRRDTPGCARGPALEADGDWSALLEGVDTIVHAAARVHVLRDSAQDPLQAFRAVNVDGSVNLARQAALAGAGRFIFLSSVKVLGEATAAGRPFTRQDGPAPEDAYALSKAEAEDRLRALAADTGMAVSIIRPPLVYGPGVKANFRALMRMLERGVPLPLGAITQNRRSLVGLDNLVDLIITCIDDPAAANETFLVSDGEDLSTTALLQKLAKAMGVPSRLLPVPAWVLTGAAALAGRRRLAQRLCGNLQVDLSHTRARLNWRPPVGVDEGLRRAAGRAQ
jgi:UDP-glucose 4-epimerase